MSQIDKALKKARARGRSPPAPIIIDPADPRDGTFIVTLETLRKVHLDPETLQDNRVLLDDNSPPSAAYKMLRTRVLQRMRRHGWKTLAVTGTAPDDGKTLTAINLSLSLARDVGTSTILVDLDLRRPAIHDCLGLKPQPGIVDCLTGKASLQAALVNPNIERLGLLLNGQSFTNSSELISAPEMARLVQDLRAGPGRIVVFDLPPLLAIDDMLAFTPLVDAVLLVVAQGKTKQEDLKSAKEMLQGVNLAGVVLNRSTEDVAPYSYYSSY